MRFRIALAIALVLGLVLPAQAAQRFTPAKRHEFCRYESWNGQQGFTDHEVDLLIACVIDHFPVSGGFAQAHYVSERESGDYCHAHNPTSSATGLYQMVAGTWASWWATLHQRVLLWGLHDNPNLCRANAIIGLLAAHRWGWGPWR